MARYVVRLVATVTYNATVEAANKYEARERFMAWRLGEPDIDEWVTDCEKVEVEEEFSAAEPARLASARS